MLINIKIKAENIYLLLTIFCYLQSFIGIIFSVWNFFSVFGWGLTLIFVVLYRKHCKFTFCNFTLLISMLFGQLAGIIYSTQTPYINTHIYKIAEFFLCYLLLGIIPQYLSLRKKVIEKILIFIIFIAIISSIYAMCFQLNGKIFTFRDANNFSITNSYVSFWYHRNIFSLILLSGMVAIIYFYQYKNCTVISTIIFIILGFNLFLTLSRTAYVAIFVFMFSYSVIEWKEHKYKAILLAAIGLFLVYMYIKYPNFKNIINTYMIRKNSGMTGRESLWKTAFNLLNFQTALHGRSIGSEQVILIGDYISQGAGFHNVFLAYMIEGGIMLIIPLYLNIIFIIKNIKNNFKCSQHNLYSWSIATILTFIIYPMFETSKYFNMGVGSFLQTFFVFTVQWLLINANKKKAV